MHPWQLIVVSDSAYKSDTQDCLAMRSGAIFLADKTGLRQGINNVQLVDFVSKKQTGVCRSTFVAELFSLLDLVGHGINISLAMTEILTGIKGVTELAKLHERGEHAVRMTAVIDAKSVLESVKVKEVKVPTDQAVYIHVLRLKELPERAGKDLNKERGEKILGRKRGKSRNASARVVTWHESDEVKPHLFSAA